MFFLMKKKSLTRKKFGWFYWSIPLALITFLNRCTWVMIQAYVNEWGCCGLKAKHGFSVWSNKSSTTLRNCFDMYTTSDTKIQRHMRTQASSWPDLFLLAEIFFFFWSATHAWHERSNTIVGMTSRRLGWNLNTVEKQRVVFCVYLYID